MVKPKASLVLSELKTYFYQIKRILGLQSIVFGIQFKF